MASNNINLERKKLNLSLGKEWMDVWRTIILHIQPFLPEKSVGFIISFMNVDILNYLGCMICLHYRCVFQWIYSYASCFCWVLLPSQWLYSLYLCYCRSVLELMPAITLLELFPLQPSVDIVSKTRTMALIINVEVIQCQIKIIRESQSSLKKNYFLLNLCLEDSKTNLST